MFAVAIVIVLVATLCIIHAISGIITAHRERRVTKEREPLIGGLTNFVCFVIVIMVIVINISH